jgi:hypothetical protein
MNQTQLNVVEAKNLLKYTIQNNIHLQSVGKKPIAISLVGDAGLGKTSLCKQIGKEVGLEPIVVSLSQLDELGDLLGFPLRQFQLCKENVPQKIVTPTTELKDGKITIVDVVSYSSVTETECLWIDEPAVPEYIKQGYNFTGDKRMVHAEPEWIAGKTEGILLILDDYSRAQQRFLQAIMELIQNQEYMTWKLPMGSSIVLTSNPDNGNYHVEAQDLAQTSRAISFELKADVNCWAQWAEEDGIDSRGINFMLMHPEILSEKVNPRAITNFLNAISSIETFSDELSLIQIIGEGSVGVETATLFTLFIHNKLDKLIHPKDILFHENESYIIGQIRSIIGTKEKFRADIAGTLAIRIVNYSIYCAKENSISKDTLQRIERLVTEEDLFSDDLNYMIVRGLLEGNKVKFSPIMTNTQVIKMAAK